MPFVSIMAVIAGMAPRAEPAISAESDQPATSSAGAGSNLALRFLSAAVLLPITFGAAWLGGLWWTILVGAFAGAMAWEWSRIVTSNGSSAAGLFNMAGAAAIIATAGAVELTYLGSATFALMVLALGAGLAAVLARGERLGWLVLGVFYVGLPSMAIVWIRAEPDGLAVLAWMLALVIAVDTGAYVAGRSIGGPKLAPRISPKKTWAGLAGGVAAALLIGAISAFLLGWSHTVPLILISGVLAVVEQAGDLAESAFKRRFGVKDSSQLIPGHGGVLDRVDGLLAVSLVVGTAGWLLGGLSGWMR
jgi:phosphatidate cytidylyltransferase